MRCDVFALFFQELTMNVLVTYLTDFVPEPAAVFAALWDGLAWERRGSTPRREYYKAVS